MKKRVLSTILALAMVLSMFTVVTFADDTTTTVTYDTSADYGWYNYLYALGVIPGKESDPESLYADLRADGTPYKIFLDELMIIKGGSAGVDADGSYMNSYMMTQEGYTDQKLYDYVQDTYGAYTYTLRGGKQMGYDAWNNVMPDGLDLVYNDAGYTYVNADAQTVYTQDSYHAAQKALDTFLRGANDNVSFNNANSANPPFIYDVQKQNYEALETALAALEPAAPALIDLTGVTSENARLQMWIDTYNNIDVEEYKAKEEVQTWGAVLKAAAEDPSTAGMGDAVDNYEKDGIAVCTYWETSVRNVVPQSNGLRAMADEVWNDPSNWPLGSVVSGPDQAEYVTEQYTAAYNKWVEIRDTMRNQFATLKVSQVIAEVESLKSMIQALEKAENDYTTEDLNAYNNLKAYISIYDGRVARIVLEASKQLENYITLKNGVDRAHEIIDAWEAGTAYAKADEMYGLISKDVSDSCTLEDSWMALRAEVGLDGGLPTFVEAYIAQWTDSGLYTEESLAAVNEMYLATRDSMKQNSSLTDEGALQYIDTLKVNLVRDLIDLSGITSDNARLQFWIDIYNNIDVAEYKELSEVQAWGAVILAAYEGGTITSSTSEGEVDGYTQGDIAICGYWETTIRTIVPQNNGLRTMADEIWNNGENWPLGENITDLNQTTYEPEAYKAAYDQWVYIRDTLRNQQATLKVSEALVELDELKSMIQNLKEVELPYDADQLAAYNNLKAYIAIYDGRVARIVLDASKQLENYITLKTGVDRVHEIITNWDAGTEYATAAEMYGLISKDVSESCTLEDSWMALRAEVGLDGGLPTFVEAYIAEWTASGLYTEESLAAVNEMYLATRDAMKQNSSLTDEGALQYIGTLKENLVKIDSGLIDLTDVTSENPRLQMWIDTYNNIDVEEYKEKEEVQAWGAVLKAAAEDPSTATMGDAVDNYEKDGIVICTYWETSVRKVVPQSEGLKAMADAVWNDSANWPLGEVITDLNQTTYEAEGYTAAYNQWANIRDTLRNQFATLKVSEALAELDALKSMIQGLKEVDLPYDAEQLAAYNNLKTYISIYDGRIARIVLDENKQLENYITLKDGIARVHEIIANWDAGTEYATADEMYGLIDKDVTNCILENAWMALRAEVGLDGSLPAFVEVYIAEWTESGLYTEESLAAMNETYMSTRDAMKQNSSLTDEGVLQYVDTLKDILVEAEKPVVPGDTDGDGKASLCDIMLASRMVVDGAEFTADQLKACDVTGDGVVTLADLLKMSRMLVENA